MKKWKKDYTPASFETLLAHLLKFAEKVLDDKKNEKDIKYDGYPLDKLTSVCALPIDYYTSAENRKYEVEEKDRSNLEMMLTIAMQIGIEQGARIYKENNRFKDRRTANILDDMKKHLKSKKTKTPMEECLLIQLDHHE